MNDKRIADGFDSCLQSEGNGLHRLCFLLVRDPREAEEVAFQALLRLAARKENDPRDDRTLLYSAALRLSSDWFGRKLRKAPRDDALREQDCAGACKYPGGGNGNRTEGFPMGGQDTAPFRQGVRPLFGAQCPGGKRDS